MSSYNHDDSFRHDRDSDAMWADFHDTARSERNDDDLVLFPGDRDELIAQVGAALREKFGKQIFIDSDGDYVLNHLGQSIWVRVHADAPVIMVFARVAHDVYSRRATEVELGILNRKTVLCKWSLAGRAVYQEAAMLGTPFVPLHLSALLDSFYAAMASTRGDLAYRIGAKVA